MKGNGHHLLLYLPSPMGDAILCTPALRAIREQFPGDRISLLANRTVREVLSPCPFHYDWIDPGHSMPGTIAQLRNGKFTHAVLFKNSLGSALTVFLARLPHRIGYSREGRGLLLTDRLHPPRSAQGRYKPISMVDYYLAIAQRLGADISRRDLELHVGPRDLESLRTRLPELYTANGPVVILVPGGAYGPSKCWPTERFAQAADRLIDAYGAVVVLSVAGNPFERQIAARIRQAAEHPLLSLGDRSVGLGELKAVFSRADLVITNDTGPRHIAIALGRKVITLFGPNDPAWTQTGYPREVQIVGRAPCAPCRKPRCSQPEHTCMRDISTDRVMTAACELLGRERPTNGTASQA